MLLKAKIQQEQKVILQEKKDTAGKDAKSFEILTGQTQTPPTDTQQYLHKHQEIKEKSW